MNQTQRGNKKSQKQIPDRNQLRYRETRLPFVIWSWISAYWAVEGNEEQLASQKEIGQ